MVSFDLVDILSDFFFIESTSFTQTLKSPINAISFELFFALLIWSLSLFNLSFCLSLDLSLIMLPCFSPFTVYPSYEYIFVVLPLNFIPKGWNVSTCTSLPLLMRVSANLFGIWWTTCLRQMRCSPPMWKAARTCPFRLVCLRRPLEVSRLDIMGNLKSLSSSGLTGDGAGACCWCCLTGRRGGMGPRVVLRWCRGGTGGRSGTSISVKKYAHLDPQISKMKFFDP